MKISIEVTEAELRSLIYHHIRSSLGTASDAIDDKDIIIEVKSKQNYKSEWESAAFRARVSVDR